MPKEVVPLAGLAPYTGGACRATIYNWLRTKRNGFPGPIKAGARNVWLVEELTQWQAARIAERDQPPKRRTRKEAAQ